MSTETLLHSARAPFQSCSVCRHGCERDADAQPRPGAVGPRALAPLKDLARREVEEGHQAPEQQQVMSSLLETSLSYLQPIHDQAWHQQMSRGPRSSPVQNIL